jgi:hypothetical protein
MYLFEKYIYPPLTSNYFAIILTIYKDYTIRKSSTFIFFESGRNIFYSSLLLGNYDFILLWNFLVSVYDPLLLHAPDCPYRGCKHGDSVR